MWLGNHRKGILAKQYFRCKRRRGYKQKKLSFLNPPLRFCSLRDILFGAPFGWSTVILKKNYYCYYFYTKTYYLILFLPPKLSFFKIDSQMTGIIFSPKILSPEIFLFFKVLNFLLLSLNFFFFQKIKFRGKGYYMYKNIRNTITPKFGHAHRIYKYNYFLSVNFLSKTKILFFGISKDDLLTLSHNIKLIKPINIFTGRGIRFAKQLVYKKTGKVSSYR